MRRPRQSLGLGTAEHGQELLLARVDTLSRASFDTRAAEAMVTVNLLGPIHIMAWPFDDKIDWTITYGDRLCPRPDVRASCWG